jgi:hypothetical protein
LTQLKREVASLQGLHLQQEEELRFMMAAPAQRATSQPDFSIELAAANARKQELR